MSFTDRRRQTALAVPALDPASEFDGAVVRFHNQGHKPTEQAVRPSFSNASAQRLPSWTARDAIQHTRKVAKDGYRMAPEIGRADGEESIPIHRIHP
jgi:hypothetical protein